ncbi:MAG: Maf family protein, partial [Nanoarchaeota archaeon]|nr:Maf family protein [Nanoarchaeota archaeon]MBU1975481.1 Maf family protein [Nanoarchaeota archaeon]
ITETEVTKVKMKEMTDEEIESYIATGEPLDKAGAFGVQDKGVIFVEKIGGCYNNIVGLPLFKLSCMLEKLGVNVLEQ